MTVVGEAFVAISPESAAFASKLQSQFGAMNFASFGAIAGGALAAGVVAGLIKIGRAFGAVKQQIQKETGQTGNALAGTFNEVKKVFAEMPDSLGKVTTAVDELTRRGVPLGRTFDTLAKQQLGLARITGTDLATNVEQTTGLFAKFGVAVKDQPALMDELFKATQKSGKALGDILGPLNANGTALQAFGFSMEDSIAIIGNLGASGIDAGRTLTALRIAFGKLTKAGEDPATAFRKLNKEFSDGTSKGKAMNDAVKLLGNRGIELARAMATGKLNFEAFLKAISDGKGGIIETEIATRSLGDKITIMAHGFLLAVQPLASSLTKGISQALTDLAGPMQSVADGAGHLVTSLAPLAAVFGGALVVAFHLILPLLGAFGRGLDTIGQALDLVPPPVLIAIAAGITAMAVGFDTAAIAAFEFGAVLDAALGGLPLIIGSIVALGAAFGVFGDGVKKTKVDTSGLEDVFNAAGDSAVSFADAMSSSREQIDKWLKSQLALTAGGQTGFDTINNLGLSFGQVSNALIGTNVHFEKFQAAMTTTAANTGLAGDAYDKFHDTLLAGREQLSINAAATVAAAQASGLLTDKQVAAAQNAQKNKGFNDDYGKSIIDNVAVLNQLTPAIERATAAQNAQAEKRVAPKFDNLASNFATGAIGAQALTDKFVGIGFTAEAAKAKVEGLKAQVSELTSTIQKSLPSGGAATEGLKNDFTQLAANVALGVGNIQSETAKLASNSDMQKFTDNLKNQAVNVATFFGNIRTLVKEGNAALARDLLEAGADKAGGLAASFVSNTAKASAANKVAEGYEHIKTQAQQQTLKLLPELEGSGKSAGDAISKGISKADIPGAITKQGPATKKAVATVFAGAAEGVKLGLTKPVTDGFSAAAKAARADHSIDSAVHANLADVGKGVKVDFVPVVKSGLAAAGKTVANDRQIAAASTNVGKASATSFAQGFDLRPKVKSAMQGAAGAVGASSGVSGAAAASGAQTGSAFVTGLVGGLSGSGAISRVRAAATVLAITAKNAANSTLGIKSPSRVGIEIGTQFAAGVAIGVLNGQTVVNENAAGLATGLVTQTRNVASSVDLLGSAGQTIQTLRNFLAQLASSATSAASTVNDAASALQTFLSTVNGALPTASSALANFTSAQASALSTQQSALATYHAASKQAAVDATHLADVHDKTANAFRTVVFLQTLLNGAIAQKLPTTQIDAVRHAYDAAVATFAHAADVLHGVSDALKDQRTAVSDAAKALREASHALDVANDPTGFTKNLNAETNKAKAFTADIRKLVSEGFVDLAKKLAEQGADAAGKLADSFTKNGHDARLANNAVKQAAKYADTFSATIDKLFGGSTANTTATKAGTSVGDAIAAGASTAIDTTFENSIKILTDKLRLVDLKPKLNLDTSRAERSLDLFANAAVNINPKLADISLPEQTIDVGVRVKALPPGSFPAQSVDVEPNLLPIPKLDPITVDVVPRVTAAQAAASAAVATVPTTSAAGGTQTLELDLTIVLEDGKTVKATKTLPVPKSGDPKQRITTEIRAS